MKKNISANQLLRTEEPESLDSERMALFAKLNKAGKLSVIKGIFQNLANLANALEDSRPDVSIAIDAIKSGTYVNLKKMSGRYLHGFFKNNMVQYDCRTGKMYRITIDDNKIHEDIEPVIVRKTDNEMLITRL